MILVQLDGAQDARPWAKNFDAQWKRIRAVNAEHMLNLSSRLDAAQNPKDELAAMLQDVVRVLPRAIKMLQEAGRSGAGGVDVRVPFYD